jgi:adenosylmethionine-8-amino-7-oxononanoate aminotransferase
MNWFETGKNNIWHPYTQMQIATEPLKVISANGSYFELENGDKILDGISSWWSVCHGYGNSHIISKMREQLEKLSHIMFAGIAHEPAYILANRLVKLAPSDLEKVFFADSGSVAVEIAMKMAVQYWRNKGNRRKKKFICFKNGYHGDTMGALSLSDPDGWIAKAFNNYMPEQFCIDLPVDEYGLKEFEEILNGLHKEVAGIIIEPLVQGAGGMKFHSPDVLAEIFKLTKQHEILFIADEIMTGFYRTGKVFACNEAAISPDILCIGKALTGGMISLAAVLTNNEIYNAFLDKSLDKAFLHGPTFMANSLACSAANASLDLFEQQNFEKKIEHIENYFNDGLKDLKTNKLVKEIRVLGAIAVIELKDFESSDKMWQFMFDLRQKFLTHKVWLRPFKNVIYIMPNYNVTDDEMDILIKAIKIELNA